MARCRPEERDNENAKLVVIQLTEIAPSYLLLINYLLLIDFFRACPPITVSLSDLLPDPESPHLHPLRHLDLLLLLHPRLDDHDHWSVGLTICDHLRDQYKDRAYSGPRDESGRE